MQITNLVPDSGLDDRLEFGRGRLGDDGRLSRTVVELQMFFQRRIRRPIARRRLARQLPRFRFEILILQHFDTTFELKTRILC